MEIIGKINLYFFVVTLIIIGSAIKGYRIGMIQSINSFVGIIFAFVALILFIVTANAYIGKDYPQILVGVLSLIIVVLTHRIISFIFSSLKLISKIPIFTFLDKILGFGVGIIEGIIDFWILGIVLMAFGNEVIKNISLAQIAENEILNTLFNNNLIALLLSYC